MGGDLPPPLTTVGNVDEGDQPRTVDVDGMELHLDPEPDATGAIHTALPPRMESWRRRSATGAILTGIGLGLKQAFEPKRDEPAIVMEASGEPLADLPVEAELGGILPADNVVRIRPWLLASSAAPRPNVDPESGSAPGPGS
jgi:hypothetical protein